MKKKLLFAAGLAVAAITGTAVVRGHAQDDALDPIRVAGDTHKLAFENKFVRVLDVHLPPGKIEPRHRHPHGMSVYFTDWQATVTPDGAKADTHQRKSGTFSWNEAIIHTVQNSGQTEGHILRI